MFYPPPIQTVLDPNQDHDPQEYTARPGNSLSQPHSNAPWLQAPTESELDAETSGAPTTSLTTSSMPGLEHGLSRPLTPIEQERLAQLDRLKFFLATAPSRWDTSASANANAPHNAPYPTPSHPALNRFLLPSQEFVTCVLWNGLYHITGTDIVRALVFRFEAFGRPVRNMKKFEEGVFSDLRNLKPGVDACLEEPKSPFLDLLFKYQCIRTQKKQKVFYWFSVPHDRLFLDALERDLKREKMGMESTTVITGEPALSFVYDPKRSLYEQFSKAQGGREGDGDLERVVRRLDEDGGPSANSGVGGQEDADADMDDGFSSADDGEPLDHAQLQQQQQQQSQQHLAAATAPGGGAQPFFSMFTLFEGSPTYKQRRKKPSNKPSGLANLLLSGNPEQERGRFPYRLSAPGHSHSTSSPSNSRHPSPSYGPDGQMVMKTEPGLSAADLFMKQARGELPREGDSAGSGANGKRVDPREVGVYYEGIQGVNPILPPHAQAQLGPHSAGQGPARMLSVPTPSTPSSGQYGNLNRGRSMDGDIYRSYSASPSNASGSGSGLVGPGQGYPQGMSLSAGYANTTFDQGTGPSNSARSFDGYPTSFTPASGQADGPSSNYMGGPPTFAELASDGPPKNHPCPLLSCGRTFKRMEHLKRHLRTHTMERPFVCPKCRKRFSRSDNLGQHLRVHERDAAEASNLNAEQGSDATASGSGSGDAASAAANNGGMNMNEFMNFTGNEPFAANSDSGIDWGLQQWINVHGEISSSDGEGDGASPDSGAGSSPSNNPGSADRNASNLDADGGELDMDADDLFSMQQQGPQTDIGVELGMFGGQGGAGMGMGMGMGGVGLAAVRRGSPSASSDAQANSAANSRRASADLFYLQQQAQQGGQWPVRTSSPTAFGDANGDGQQQQSHPQHANSLPLMGHPSARQQFAQSRHSSTGSVFGGAPLSLGAMSIGSAGTVEDQNGSQFLTIPGSHHIPASLSAPPHKQVFDANAMMFGPEGEDFGAQSQSLNNSPNMHQGLTLAARGLGLMESSAGGAVRRHRSMTPSLHRSGDSFSRSRPGTANSMSGEFPPGTFDNPPAPARGYHPYSTTSSRGGSVTNSPMVGAGMGLDTMGYPMQQRRSPSRASSSHMGSADQGVSANMHHLSLGSGSSLGLSGLERPGSSLSVHSVHSTGGSFGGDVYRTESPTPFMSGQQEQRGSPNASGMQMTDSPSQFLTDLPPSSSYSAQHVPGQQSLNPQQSSSIPRFDKNSNTMFQQLSGDQFGAPFTMDGMDMSSDGHYMGYGQPQHVSSM